jgi:hypothetical protein
VLGLGETRVNRNNSGGEANSARRDTYNILEIDVGPCVKKKLYGARVAMLAGLYQGCHLDM